jgi:hypothetical protein
MRGVNSLHKVYRHISSDEKRALRGRQSLRDLYTGFAMASRWSA